MIIDFAKIAETAVTNFHGGDGDTIIRAVTDQRNRIMCNKLVSGSSIGYHSHQDDSEMIYIISGDAKVIFDDQAENLTTGMCHYCPKGHAHSLINSGDSDLLFFAVVAKQ